MTPAEFFELATANGVFEGMQEAVQKATELLRRLLPSQTLGFRAAGTG